MCASVLPALGLKPVTCRAGPAIVHFQQTRQGFWEPLVLFIGICEAFRINRGWADPVENGVFTLREDYIPGDVACAFCHIHVLVVMQRYGALLRTATLRAHSATFAC